jgi:hypothetical protein
MRNSPLPRHVHSVSIPRLGVLFVCNFPLLRHRILLLLPRVASARLLGVPASSGARGPGIAVIAGSVFTSKSGYLIGQCREGGV